MNNQKIKSTFVIASTLLILVVLLFTGGLNIATFKENYTESIVSSYSVAGGESVRNIEYAVKYGKPLDNFLGIESILQEILTEIPTIDEVNIVLPDGRIIYDQHGAVEDERLSERLMNEFHFDDVQENADYMYVLNEGKYYVFLPIQNRNAEWIGSLNLVFNERVVTEDTNPYMWKLVSYLVGLAVISFVSLFLFVQKFSIVDENGKILKKRILTSLILILGVVQLFFGWINYQMFDDAYNEIARSNTSYTANVINKDIQSVIEKGVSYESLYKVEDYLENIIQSTPIIEMIRITNNDQVLYSTDGSESSEQIGADFLYRLDLVKDIDDRTAQLEVVISEQYIVSKMRDIILDTITIAVTSFLFMVELTLFILFYLRRKLTITDVEEKEFNQEVAIVRPLAFILFFGIFMSISFIPLVMSELYEPIFSLSRNIILGLPISAEMLFGALSTILVGSFIDRRGWKKAFYIGLVIIGTGTLFSGLASGAVSFIVARAIVGAGYGFCLMSLRSFVNKISIEKIRTAGLSSLFAGMYAGLNCGVIVGAMLADRIGFSNVFFVSFSMLVFTAIFAMMYAPKDESDAPQEMVEKLERARANIVKFMSQKQVAGLFLLIIIPTAISGMFLDYFFPLYAEGVGLSASNVGRAFLLNGLCIVYLGPFLSRHITKYLGDFKTILVGGLLIVIGILFFSWQGSVVAAFITIILLGVSDSFGLVAQNNYFVKLQATREIGIGKALGIFDNTRKIGQMVGPMVFGSVLTMGFFGISMLGFVFLISLLLFLVIGRTKNI